MPCRCCAEGRRFVEADYLGMPVPSYLRHCPDCAATWHSPKPPNVQAAHVDYRGKSLRDVYYEVGLVLPPGYWQ